MRNLTKVLAMVLAFTMMVSVAGFAATYTDVEASANYAEAVSVLSDLGLVKGYEDGTFGADKTLTRAEAATLVVRLMGLGEAAEASMGATDFSDVPADHWATGYINVAATRGVVAGMGNGTFEPDAELEYAQIVKMIVVALGYQPQAEEAGEWPTNYISTATNITLTKGIAGKASDKVTRATTARLLYAALTIPKMAKSGVGVSATHEPTDTLIIDDLGIYKLLGSVSAVDAVEGNATISIDKQGLALNKKYKETADEDDWTYDADATTVETGVLAATLKGMIGVPAYIYVADVEGDLTIVSIVERKNISSVSFTSEDYKEYDDTKAKLTIYVDEDQNKTTSIKLAEEISVRINGGDADTMTAEEFAEAVAEGAYLVDLKDTAESDDKYDYANLTMFQYMVVGEVDVNKDETVYTFEAEDDFVIDLGIDTLEIDTENEDTAISIIKNNAIIDVEEIAEGDILNIIVNEMDDDELIEGTIYVTNDTVEGTVKYVDDTEGKIVLDDGSEFKYYNDYGVNSNTEATFYFDMTGKMIYVGNESAKSAFEYGFATNVEFTAKNGVLKNGTIRVLKADGEWATLDLKATVKVNGSSTKINGVESETEWDAFVADFDAADDLYDSQYPTVAINNVIAYKLDATGAVKEIISIEDGEDAENGWNATGVSKKFSDDEDVKTFGAYTVDETTVVFNIVEGYVPDNAINFEETKITVTDINVFEDAETYTGMTFININEKTEFVPVIVGSFVAAIDFEANYFVVSKVLNRTLKDFDDEEVIQIEGMQAGEKVVYYYSVDREPDVKGVDYTGEEIALDDDVIVDTFGAGDIMIVNADSNGFITTGAVLANVYADFFAVEDDEYIVDEFGADEFDATVAAVDGVAVDGEDNGAMFVAFVAEKASLKDRFYLADEIAGDAAADATNFKGATVTVYDLTETKVANMVTKGDVEEGSVVFGRVDEDGKVKEVVVIICEYTEDYEAE